jgi:hypothetical protein
LKRPTTLIQRRSMPSAKSIRFTISIDLFERSGHVVFDITPVVKHNAALFDDLCENLHGKLWEPLWHPGRWLTQARRPSPQMQSAGRYLAVGCWDTYQKENGCFIILQVIKTIKHKTFLLSKYYYFLINGRKHNNRPKNENAEVCLKLKCAVCVALQDDRCMVFGALDVVFTVSSLYLSTGWSKA